MIKRWLYRLAVRWLGIQVEDPGHLPFIESLQKDVARQHEQILKQIVEINQLKAQLASISLQIANAAAGPVSQDVQIVRLKREITDLQNRLSLANIRITDQHTEIESFRDQEEIWKGNLKEAYEANDLLESERDLLKESVGKLRGEIEAQKYRVDRFQDELSSERSLSASLSEGQEKLRAELAGSQDVIAGLNGTVDGLTKQQASLDELVKLLDEKNIQLELELDVRLQEHAKEKARADKLQSDVDEALGDLASMQRAVAGEVLKKTTSQMAILNVLSSVGYIKLGMVVAGGETQDDGGSSNG